MSAGGYLNGCGFIPVSTGTGDFVVSAAVQGYATPATSGAVNTTVYTYRAESADKSQWEIGFGAYTVSTTTLARTTILLSSTGAKVSFSAAPNVFVTAATADLQNASLLTSGLVSPAVGGTGVSNPAAHTIPINQGSGAQSNTGTGSLGQFIASTGASSDPIMAGGPWTQVGNTLSASNSATLSDTTSITSTYNEYEIVFTNLIPATNSVTAELQIHSGGAFKSSGYVSQSNDALSTTAGGQTATTFIQLSLASNMFNGAPGLSGSIRVSNPSTSAIHAFHGTFNHAVTASTAGAFLATGYWNTAGAVDGFQFLFSTGNITSGTIKIYGRL